jgi:hypothetical protein
MTRARTGERRERRRPRRQTRRIAVLAAVTLGSVAAVPASAGAEQATPAGQPLPASNYTVQEACPPAPPGYDSCLALRLVAKTAAARAHRHPIGMTRTRPLKRGGKAAEICSPPTPQEGCYGLRPSDLHSGYQLPTESAIPQTVAIVDAYDDPTIESDLQTYDTAFGLPACTKASGCFKKVNQEGNASPLPATEGGWAGEISLDVETTHAICPNCRIILVEANDAFSPNLEAAENTAARLGATEISNSWGGPEEATDTAAFNHPGVVIAAATGDFGYLNWDSGFAELIGHPDYPATSPHVVAVGGTRLHLNSESKWTGESVWNDGSTSTLTRSFGAGGGGCSEHFTAPSWQQSVADWTEVGCATRRASADVAADADPYTGVAVYDSTPEEPGEPAPGWMPIGGTSLASPIIASVFALAGGSGGVNYPAETLYSHLGSATMLRDVTAGSNGKCTKPFHEHSGESGCTTTEEAEQCAKKLICLAGTGYDGPSGVGTPNGVGAFTPPPPTVTAVEPTSGNIGGNRSVKITGTDLLGASKVKFGAAEATEVNVVSASEVKVKSPPHAAETVDVTVITPGGTSATTLADHYTYVTPPPPTVTVVSPSGGTIVGGNTVKITGTSLEDASRVEFGGTSGTEVHEISAGEITVKAPPHAAETVDVTVTTPGGTSATTLADHYTYVTPPPPTVTAVAPLEGSTAGGTAVKVTGTNLENASAVAFGESAGSEIHVTSATELTVKSPPHAAETVDVTVTTPGGTSSTSSADHYSFIAPPTVTAVEPSEGPTAGGTAVKVTGTNLENASAVAFGASAGSEIHVASATELTIKSPPHAAGTVDVTVTTPGGTSGTSSADHYTFKAPPPTVTAVAPLEGPTAGGTVVKVTGANLENASAVAFGAFAGSEISVASATELTIKSPPHAAGTVDVTVTTPGGTSGTSSADHFTFNAPPPPPPAGEGELPGAGGGSSLASSPFTSAPPSSGASTPSNAFSNFNVLGEQVNRKTGAVKLTVAVFHGGTLHWLLTFRDRVARGAGCSRHRSPKPKCRLTTIVFGEGTQAVPGARTITFTVAPAPAARRELNAGAGLSVQASLSYTASGGAPIAQSSSVSVRLKKAGHARGRRA